MNIPKGVTGYHETKGSNIVPPLQSAFTFSKLTIKTLEQDVKCVQN